MDVLKLRMKFSGGGPSLKGSVRIQCHPSPFAGLPLDEASPDFGFSGYLLASQINSAC